MRIVVPIWTRWSNICLKFNDNDFFSNCSREDHSHPLRIFLVKSSTSWLLSRMPMITSNTYVGIGVPSTNHCFLISPTARELVAGNSEEFEKWKYCTKIGHIFWILNFLPQHPIGRNGPGTVSERTAVVSAGVETSELHKQMRHGWQSRTILENVSLEVPVIQRALYIDHTLLKAQSKHSKYRTYSFQKKWTSLSSSSYRSYASPCQVLTVLAADQPQSQNFTPHRRP